MSTAGHLDGLRLHDGLGLPTFEFRGSRLYKRATLLFERGRVARVFYAVYAPNRSAADVAWLASR